MNRDTSNKERYLPYENWGVVTPFCPTKKKKKTKIVLVGAV